MSTTIPPDDSSSVVVLAREFSAVVFDLDGVVTNTAGVHAAAWTEALDVFLQKRAQKDNVPFAPFTPADYRTYVDGRPRLEAIRTFLAARSIALPEGKASDGPDRDTVHGLGARKNQLFLDRVRTHGVDVYPSTVALIRRLRGLGFKIGLVTASRNCAEIVRATGLASLFDATVDGTDQAALSLRGKPAPDTFLEATRRLGKTPERTIVVEDATAGVAAARAGGFGLVVGVDRGDNGEALRSQGADVVVPDLAALELRSEDSPSPSVARTKAEPDVHRLDPFIRPPKVERRHAGAIAHAEPWVLAYDKFDPALEGRRETLLALGNGYFVTRGAGAEARADDIHYPGTYLAGGYNRLSTEINGRLIEHEDLVNLPNWLPLALRIDDGDWLDLRRTEVLNYRQKLDVQCGLYERTVRVRDLKGRQTSIVERRFVHQQEKHLAGQHVTVRAENWSGRVTVRTLLDGGVKNAGVLR